MFNSTPIRKLFNLKVMQNHLFVVNHCQSLCLL